MTVYTHDLRVKLFEHITTHFGPWNIRTWLGCGQSPSTMSGKDIFNVFVTIYNDLDPFFQKAVNDGLTTKKPKSPAALQQQMQWCLTSQKTMDAGQIRNQRRLRQAAYEAGFLSMHSILDLETKARFNGCPWHQ